MFFNILVLSLECYVCDNQDGNTDKCLNTIKTCEQEDDRCLSIIRWSTTPYWSQVSRQKFKLYIHSRLNLISFTRLCILEFFIYFIGSRKTVLCIENVLE